LPLALANQPLPAFKAATRLKQLAGQVYACACACAESLDCSKTSSKLRKLSSARTSCKVKWWEYIVVFDCKVVEVTPGGNSVSRGSEQVSFSIKSLHASVNILKYSNPVSARWKFGSTFSLGSKFVSNIFAKTVCAQYTTPVSEKWSNR
jgi:hypothetical protein